MNCDSKWPPLDEILKLDPTRFDSNWAQIDQVIWSLKTVHEQIAAWQAIAGYLEPHPVSKGMPFFRLGHMYLVSDPDAKRASEYLEKAYKEDMEYGPDQVKSPHRMGAYRLLALTKGFIEYLEGKENWEVEQLQLPHRPVLMKTLLAVYDASLVHILDSEGHTYQSFFATIQDKNLVRFAIENYFLAERLIEMFFVSGPHRERILAKQSTCLSAIVAEVYDCVRWDAPINCGLCQPSQTSREICSITLTSPRSDFGFGFPSEHPPTLPSAYSSTLSHDTCTAVTLQSGAGQAFVVCTFFS